MDDIAAIIDRLRRSGSDTTNVEAKSAVGGFPESVVPTMAALANLPGGGLILLGIDEARNFAAVHLRDPAALMSALASRARQAFEPPIMLHVEPVDFEGQTIVVARIHETSPDSKPCRLKRGGAAYLRFWDGDYQLSELEIQGFYANRTQPRYDVAPVPGTGRTDLDSDLVTRFIDSIRDGDRRFTRYRDDREVLVKSGVLTADGRCTVAGLLALGELPQQWFPNFVIQAAAAPEPADNADIRIGDRARFSGPIPVMLDDAINWVRGHSRRRVRENSLTGRVGDSFDLPPIAVRELIANTLVHRDLADWSWSRAIELRITQERFVLTNPGGLFGVSVDRLGQYALSSARNATLLRICQFIGLPDGNAVEALATGMAKILAATSASGVVPPLFFDQQLSFTAILRREDRVEAAPAASSTDLNATQRMIYDALQARPMKTSELAGSLALTPDAVRKALRPLVAKGLVIRDGGQGQPSTAYRVA